ncbi:unnamed protein product [Caenorhabditis sp. 36 PRJEB53466]|nr:unnamed protein product [Caenorhabditis sp. 36 PRJEB53466]
MYVEYDEGLGISPPPNQNFASFIPDEEYSYAPTANNKTTSFIFPQKLDLSSLNRDRKKANKKKLSPIKPYHDSSIEPRKSARNLSNFSEKIGTKTVDLDSFRREFDDLAVDVINTSMRKSVRSVCGSVTSDRASSVSSAASISQRSLSIELRRLNERMRLKSAEKRAEEASFHEILSDSEFRLSSDDDTRPPSSQASLAEETVENVRQLSEMITELSSDGRIRGRRIAEHKKKNAATSTSGFLSDTFLTGLYKNRNPSENERTLVQSDPDEKTIVDEVFEDFRPPFRPATPSEETPILRSARDQSVGDSTGFDRIERPRNACTSVPLIGEKQRSAGRDGVPSGGIHKSLSTIQVSPEKLRELQKHAHMNRSLPNLERFVVRPSTRNIFNTNLDIDEICKKGLRKNQKSSERIFGGAEAARNIHGAPEISSKSTESSQKLRKMSRPTTASAAKQKGPRTRSSSSRPPPYCSTTPTDGIPYSITTVSQNLLGTVKSLHPDWLPIIRRLLRIDDPSADVCALFRAEIDKQQLVLELKFSRNCRLTSEEYDDCRTKIGVLFRIAEKLDELRSRGGNYSRVQQIKLIHTALLSA